MVSFDVGNVERPLAGKIVCPWVQIERKVPGQGKGEILYLISKAGQGGLL
jgi:hypothetical protein